MNFYSPFSQIDDFPQEHYFKFAAPYWLRHQHPTSDAIVICLHGFTATNYETKVLADPLFKAGYDVAGLLFPAHGLKNASKAMKAMNRLNYQTLLDVTRKTLDEAHKLYRIVYIYGQSMGGAISLIMAEEHRVDGCAVTAPAIKIKPFKKFLIGLLAWTNLCVHDKEETDFFNEAYDFTSVHAGKQVMKLAKLAKKNLALIKCPLLVCHSHNDNTIDPVIVHWIENKVESHLETAWFNQSGHTMPLDVQGEEVIKRIVSFFNSL